MISAQAPVSTNKKARLTGWDFSATVDQEKDSANGQGSRARFGRNHHPVVIQRALRVIGIANAIFNLIRKE